MRAKQLFSMCYSRSVHEIHSGLVSFTWEAISLLTNESAERNEVVEDEHENALEPDKSEIPEKQLQLNF